MAATVTWAFGGRYVRGVLTGAGMSDVSGVGALAHIVLKTG
jgi:hypothetical protein